MISMRCGASWKPRLTLRRDVEGKIDALSLRMTVRMGVMLAAGVAALAAIIKL